MLAPRARLAPGRSISRLLSLVLVGVLATSASAAGSADLSITPGTWEPQAEAGAPVPSPAPTAEIVAEASADTADQVAVATETETTEPAVEVEATTASASLDPAPSAGPFEMNLFEKGDFVRQATGSMCVGSASQTMMNIIDTGESNRSTAYQTKLYNLARQLSVSQKKLSSSGADPSGWAAVLNKKGYGPYVLEFADTRAGAMKKAATAIRETGKPVGLVVWGGRHAWVMSGFTATADPAYTTDFKVTGAYIEDPLGEVSANTLVRMNRLAQEFREYRRGGLYPRREGKYVLILPVLEE